jgi:hypothetical protein
MKRAFMAKLMMTSMAMPLLKIYKKQIYYLKGLKKKTNYPLGAEIF